MGTTRSVILSLVLMLSCFVTSLAVHAQQAEKIPRVGVIANRMGYDAFREGLRDLAYKEGENIALEFRSTEAREDRKSTRLNSSHGYISYAVFCLKKKKDLNLRSSTKL